MAVSGAQIRREQEESRRRSQFRAYRQVAAPLPPPWDSFWRRRKRIDRWCFIALLAFWPAAFATGWLVNLIRPLGNATFAVATFGYYLVLVSIGSRTALICPRCGYLFQIGRGSQKSCQHCGLLYGQKT
jgi:hypothetical protein